MFFDVEVNLPWWVGLLFLAVMLAIALPGAVPLAWAAAHRWQRHRVLAALTAALVGAGTVAFGFVLADKLAPVFFPPRTPVPKAYWVGPYLPAWLIAWGVFATRNRPESRLSR
ncbi:hypothetical protein [Micromonospora sp. NPDC005806]|uniref:hypothetical protein n=1 Tax=Micromonospora sp. NPDC005806 TaxID=3364234 RepID=UPI0036A2AF68